MFPTEHNNDVVQYADALIEKGQRPRFERWFPEFAQNKAREITAKELTFLLDNEGMYDCR